HLVPGQWSVSDAGGNSGVCLVEGPNGQSQPRFFMDGRCGGGVCGTRVGYDASGNARGMGYRGTLGSYSGLDNHRVAGRLRAPLPAGWPPMARVGGGRPADVVADSQFRFLAKYQLSRDY